MGDQVQVVDRGARRSTYQVDSVPGFEVRKSVQARSLLRTRKIHRIREPKVYSKLPRLDSFPSWSNRRVARLHAAAGNDLQKLTRWQSSRILMISCDFASATLRVPVSTSAKGKSSTRKPEGEKPFMNVSRTPCLYDGLSLRQKLDSCMAAPPQSWLTAVSDVRRPGKKEKQGLHGWQRKAQMLCI